MDAHSHLFYLLGGSLVVPSADYYNRPRWKFRTAREWEKRMGAMESRSTTFESEIEGERRRALIMGGWSDESPAQSTLKRPEA